MVPGDRSSRGGWSALALALSGRVRWYWLSVTSGGGGAGGGLGRMFQCHYTAPRCRRRAPPARAAVLFPLMALHRASQWELSRAGPPFVVCLVCMSPPFRWPCCLLWLGWPGWLGVGSLATALALPPVLGIWSLAGGIAEAAPRPQLGFPTTGLRPLFRLFLLPGPQQLLWQLGHRSGVFCSGAPAPEREHVLRSFLLRARPGPLDCLHGGADTRPSGRPPGAWEAGYQY